MKGDLSPFKRAQARDKSEFPESLRYTPYYRRQIMEYTEQVMDHFMNPRNMGDMDDASGVGTVGNAKCGDIMRIYIKVENDVITDVKFKTFGCGAAIATSSKATEIVKGMTLAEAEKVTNKMVMEALGGLPPVKVHCSVLAEEALHAAIQDYRERLERGEAPRTEENDEAVRYV